MIKIKNIISLISPIGPIGLMRPVSFISLISFVSLVSSCSGSDDLDDGLSGEGVQIGEVMSYAIHLEENTLTRAWTPPTGYVAYEGGDQPIAIAFTQDGQTPKMGHFFKSNGKWRTSLGEISAGNYYLYGFIPNLPVIKYSITDWNGGDTDGEKKAEYSKGAIMTLKDVPTVMDKDLCVVIGAKDGTDKEHDNGLTRGNFKYEAAEITKDGGEGNFVFLLFDHLYAALRINMKVYDNEYADLRKIKLKSLQLSTKADDVTTKQKNTITVTLNANDGSTSPISNIKYAQTGDPIDGGIEFWSSTSGEWLTTEFSTYDGYFLPQNVNTLVLTSIYDVYDRKGNLIRENCKVTNSAKLSNLLTDQLEAARGKRYTINMTIQPTYLYQLSEPDLDNPTVIIN